jgi:hypothetical protein
MDLKSTTRKEGTRRRLGRIGRGEKGIEGIKECSTLPVISQCSQQLIPLRNTEGKFSTFANIICH